MKPLKIKGELSRDRFNGLIICEVFGYVVEAVWIDNKPISNLTCLAIYPRKPNPNIGRDQTLRIFHRECSFNQ